MNLTSLSILSALCLAQPQGPTVLASAPATALHGKTVTLMVTVTVPSGYHIYGPKDKSGIPTAISFTGPAAFKASVQYPKTTEVKSAGETSAVYTGTVHIPVLVSVPKAAKGKVSFHLTVTTQACNDVSCLPPDTKTFALATSVK